MKVSIAKFKYDKGVGTPTKNRKLLVLSKPSDSYFGIEFDDESEVEAGTTETSPDVDTLLMPCYNTQYRMQFEY